MSGMLQTDHCCSGCASFLHGYERPVDPSTIRDMTLPPTTPEDRP